MEDTKCGAVVGNEDIFEMIKRAIMVAASDHPREFQTRRHKIAQALFSDELIKCHNNKFKKESPKVSPKTADETNMVSVLINEEGQEWNKSHTTKPPMEKQIVPTCKQQRPRMITLKLISGTKFQIPMGPATPEKKVDDHGSSRVYSDDVVAEVLRIKKILEEKSECESVVVCELLKKLQSMGGLSMKTLEETMIGKTVSDLKKHASSEKVRETAATLVKAWKRTVDEWIKTQSNNVVEPITSHLKVKPPTSRNIMNAERKLEGSEKAASKIGNGGGVMDDSSKKLEAAKRKLREGYAKVENMKKKRRVQVMELHDVMKQGLLPPHIDHDHHKRKVYGRR